MFSQQTTVNYATVSVGVGLIGLALYQFSQGDIALAVQSVFTALAAFGLKLQQAKTQELTLKMSQSPKYMI